MVSQHLLGRRRFFDHFLGLICALLGNRLLHFGLFHQALRHFFYHYLIIYLIKIEDGATKQLQRSDGEARPRGGASSKKTDAAILAKVSAFTDAVEVGR